MKVIKGSKYVYRDVKGRIIESLTPLSCPVFAFDAMSGALEGKQIGRDAKVAAEKVDIRVDQVEKQQYALAAAMEARITQLERENKALKEQVGTVTQIDLGQLAQKIFELAEAARERKALQPVESNGRVLQIPPELAEVIDVVGIPVEAEIVEDDEDVTD